jgi:hypothetical protein
MVWGCICTNSLTLGDNRRGYQHPEEIDEENVETATPGSDYGHF